MHSILLLTLAAAAVDGVPLTLLDLSEHPYARCMDGTPAGFYRGVRIVAEDALL